MVARVSSHRFRRDTLRRGCGRLLQWIHVGWGEGGWGEGEGTTSQLLSTRFTRSLIDSFVVFISLMPKQERITRASDTLELIPRSTSVFSAYKI